jgi:hypothetical protein
MKENIKLHISHIDHVVMYFDPKYLIAANVVGILRWNSGLVSIRPTPCGFMCGPSNIPRLGSLVRLLGGF